MTTNLETLRIRTFNPRTAKIDLVVVGRQGEKVTPGEAIRMGFGEVRLVELLEDGRVIGAPPQFVNAVENDPERRFRCVRSVRLVPHRKLEVPSA